MGEISGMCGRLVISEPDLSIFVAPFHVQRVEAVEWQPRYNLAPSQAAPLITNEPVRRLTLARFGLIPRWARQPRISNRLINARVEGVANSKVYKDALRKRRGVVPVTGYFEWFTTAHSKRPIFVHDARGQVLALASLWDRWRSPSGHDIESFAVLTRPSTGFLADIHPRMPFALRPSEVEQWLSAQEQPPRAWSAMLTAEADVGHLLGRQVSELANSPRNDGPQCIAEAVEPEACASAHRQLELFEDIRTTPRATQLRKTR